VKLPDNKKKSNERGVVMIKHIPHGFYEKQMTLFFNQFGKVTNLKVYRSQKTGRSLGYAFVEFMLKEVAVIVAETMNNYLMFTKLLNATLVENPTPKIFMGRRFDENTCAGAFRRRGERVLSNKMLSEDEAKARKTKGNKKLKSMKRKLDRLGIKCDIQVAGDIRDEANETTNSSIVSVDFSSDEEISVRMKRKSVVDAVNMPNKKKKLVKKSIIATESPALKTVRRSTRKSLGKRKSVA